MATNETKQKQAKQNDAESYSVTIGVTLSEQEQIDAAKQKAVSFNAANPDKLMAIGKPSATRDGLKVEFGVTK